MNHINIKQLFRKCWCLALFSWALLGIPTEGRAESRPNIIFILVDDLRWDALSCTGHQFAKTPNIDRIAKEGAKFENFFVTTPLCSPSRGSFLTGQYAHTHGVRGNGDSTSLSKKLVTFPRLLQESGYESAYVGKLHMGTDASRRPGFDYWVCLPGQGSYENPRININGEDTKLEGYCTDILNEHAVKFLKQEHKKPFVLCLNHKAVHGPFTPAERHKRLYEGEILKPVPSLNDSLKGKPALTRPVEEPGAKKNRRRAEARAQVTERTRSMGLILSQLRCLASIDEGVGEIFKALEETKQLDNTLIIFTSDNGYFWSEHGLGDKRWAYEESIRAPLLMRYPKLLKPKSTFDQLVLNIDIAPTLLDLGGTSIPATVEGKSILPLLKNKKTKWRDSVFLEYFQEKAFPRMPSWQAIRTDDWIYIHYTELTGMDELYNLKKDRYQMNNLIDDRKNTKILEDMKAKLTPFAAKK